MIRRHRHRHDRKSKRHDRGKGPLLAIFVHFVMYFFIMHIDFPHSLLDCKKHSLLSLSLSNCNPTIFEKKYINNLFLVLKIALINKELNFNFLLFSIHRVLR